MRTAYFQICCGLTLRKMIRWTTIMHLITKGISQYSLARSQPMNFYREKVSRQSLELMNANTMDLKHIYGMVRISQPQWSHCFLLQITLKATMQVLSLKRMVEVWMSITMKKQLTNLFYCLKIHSRMHLRFSMMTYLHIQLTFFATYAVQQSHVLTQRWEERSHNLNLWLYRTVSTSINWYLRARSKSYQMSQSKKTNKNHLKKICLLKI